MSVSNIYQNPSTLPSTGPYTWVPSLTPDGGSTGYGYNFTKIERGQFRNDLPQSVDSNYGQIISTVINGVNVSGSGSENWPFFAAFRTLPQPQENIGAAPTQPFVLAPDSNNKWQWQIKILDTPKFATFQITYSLIVDITQPSILPLLTSADQALLAKWQSGGNQGDPPGIDWTQYAWGQVTFVDTTGKEIEYPAFVDKQPVQLVCTDFTPRSSYKTLTTQIKLSTRPLPSDFPNIEYINVKNRYNLNAITLQVNKVMLFNALRVNIPNTMLPCSLLVYAANVSFPFTADQTTQLAYPSYSTTPNFHLKVFSPDYTGLSVGFAHSIRLEFLIAAIPIPGSALQDTSLIGLLTDTNSNDLWLVSFIGPIVGHRSVQLTFIDQAIVNATGRVIEMDAFDIPKNCTQLYLQKAQGYSGSSAPSDNVQWATLNNSTIIPGVVQNLNTVSGPFVSNYLYLDTGAKSTDWYRIVQTLSSGQFTSAPIKNGPYSERSVYSMMDSTDGGSSLTKVDNIIRRVPLIENGNPMQIKPFIVFSGQDTNPYNPISFEPGAWELNFRGCVSDPSLLTDTHIFARFWFQPSDSTYDVNSNTPQYQNSTEVHFETTNSGSSLVLGPPTSLDQMLVSPPLPNTLTQINVARYTDNYVGFPTNWNPFSSGSQLVVALYAVSYLTSAGSAVGLTNTTVPSPTFTFELNSSYAYVTTTIQQPLSNTLYPQHADRYGYSNYVSYPSPLYVSNQYIGAGTFNSGNLSYAEYDGKYQSSSQAVSDAFTGLLALQTSTSPDNTKFCLPYTEIAITNDQSTIVYGDFATNAKSLGLGRVDNGNWDITTLLNIGVDTPHIITNYRLEGFLATEDGTVTEYIFRSPLLSPSTISSTQQKIEYIPTINIPYEISGDNTQLIIRLTAYPYYSGQIIPINTLQTNLGTTPLGCRVDSLSILSNTLKTLDLHETASLLGSPAFYENLPLVPTEAIDSQQFWFVASPDLLSESIVPGDGTFSITGQLYSPAWKLNLPKDIEVDFGANTVEFSEINSCVKFRTVLGDETGLATEQKVSVAQDKISGIIHVVHDTVDTNVSAQSVSAMSTNTTIIHHTFNQPYDPPLSTVTLSGNNNKISTPLYAYNPSICMVKSKIGSDYGSQLSIVATIDEAQTPTFVTANNNLGGSFSQWTTPTDDGTFNSLQRITSGLNYPSVIGSRLTNLVTVVGWAKPGSIIVKELNLLDVPNDGKLPSGTVFLIDGSPSPQLFENETFITPYGGSGTGAIAVQTAPSIAINDSEQIIVAYVLQGYDGDIYMRMALSGQAFSTPKTIVSLSAMGIARSSNIACFAPTLVSHEGFNAQYILWWCGGKILLSTVDINHTGNTTLGIPQLVAGSRDFTKTTNAANSSFAQLQKIGSLIVNQSGAVEADLPRQQAGAIVCGSWPSQGSVWVYYRDNSGKLFTRQVHIEGNVGEQIPISATPTQT